MNSARPGDASRAAEFFGQARTIPRPSRRIACALSLLLATACAPGEAAQPAWWSASGEASAEPPPPGSIFALPPPPFSEGVFPCSDCHDPELPVRSKRRTLRQAHQEIVLDHAEEQRWCLDCHDAADRDVLHLANGEPVAFEESHRLCGQCHGEKHRDWRAGAHGRRTGRWDGEKQYLLCVHCHDAHAPRFAPLRPEPPPNPPRRTP